MTQRNLAFKAIETIMITRQKSDRVTAAMRELWPDLSGFRLPSDDIEAALVDMIDFILGDEQIGSYFLYECLHMTDGGRIEVNGKGYPIRTLDDLRAYVDAEMPEPV